jgi:hypothetical protein
MTNIFMKPVFFIKYLNATKVVTQVTSMLGILALLSGCAGMLQDSIGRSMSTGDTYNEMAKALPPPSKGMGRLYIYRTEKSTASHLTGNPVSGMTIRKSISSCDIDGSEFRVMWKTFAYVDLPEGQHKVSCPSTFLKALYSNPSKAALYASTNLIEVTISHASDVFVLLDITMEGKSVVDSIFQPILVNSIQARKEIAELPHYEKAFGYK